MADLETALSRLSAGLDDDEAIALAASPRGLGWDVRSFENEGIAAFPTAGDPEELGGQTTLETRHMERHSPARVLRDVEVLRRIVDLYRVYASTDLDALGPENRLRIVAGRETLEGVLEELADIYCEEQS